MILHIVRRGEWERALERGEYAPGSIAAEGFIHCSTPAQVAATADLHYRGQRDLVLLCIDEARLVAPLKYEMPRGAGDARAAVSFPHIYGALNPSAVIRVIDFPCAPDGSFLLPAIVSASTR
ncbi:MAG: DUF952 domain-containing protein [Candidatus Binataceae bacterium]|nr:DUF952 domain-containing protein [Candidatus Binataceae bacterium]